MHIISKLQRLHTFGGADMIAVCVFCWFECFEIRKKIGEREVRLTYQSCCKKEPWVREEMMGRKGRKQSLLQLVNHAGSDFDFQSHANSGYTHYRGTSHRIFSFVLDDEPAVHLDLFTLHDSQCSSLRSRKTDA